MIKRTINKNEILDCTIRDGGYVNNWDFDRKLVRETYRALSKAGVDYVELGYHGTKKYFDENKFGTFRFCPVEVINEVCLGISGSKVSIMVDFGKFDIADLKQYLGSPVKLIRIAFHKDKLDEAFRQAEIVKNLGFLVSVNLMGFSSFTVTERKKVFLILRQIPLDYAYIADTYGSMFPNQIKEYIEPLLEIKQIKLGFHPHNNLQMAFANSLASLAAGTQIVDGSVYGMGRGAGNMPTEIMLSYLQLIKPERYNVIPVLNLIANYYYKLQKEYHWGYALPYMVSGIHKCHPDYAKNLVDCKEYDMEDIWNILEIVKEKQLVGFKKNNLDLILRKGMFGIKRASFNVSHSKFVEKEIKVNYVDCHKEKDFLILANGPSLKEKTEQINKFINKFKPVVMGANNLMGLFIPDYHAFSNKRRFVDYINSVNNQSKLLLSEHIPESMIKEYTDRNYDLIYYKDTFEASFEIKNNIVLTNCRTVSILLVAIAIIMGAKRIFLAGMDGYLDKDINGKFHFYNEEEAPDNEMIREKHQWNLRYLQEIDEYLTASGQEGLHIITPTSYKKFYKGIENYLDVLS